MHVGLVESGEVRHEQEAHGQVDPLRREATARAHTSTHIVHWTLKHLLGEHARQAGSLVAPGRLRFDFPHPSAVPHEVLEEAELEANRRLALDDAVRIYETTFDEAKAQGAIALFGEKYGDLVRVVEVGDYSRELCGGTHVHRTGNVSLIKILHEGSIGAGMRRVEALVGPDALREINAERALLRGLVDTLGSTDPASAIDRARQLVERVKRLETELGKIRQGDVDSRVDRIAAQATEVEGVRLVAALEDVDPDELRALAQKVVGKLEGNGGAAVVLGSANGGKALIVAASSKRLVERGVTAPVLLEVAAKQIGGGAGGKPIMGFAGGPNGGGGEGGGGRHPRAPRGAPGREVVWARRARPGRVLGLDLGDARIGVAVSDDDRRMAVPLGTIHTGLPADLKAVAKLVDEHAATRSSSASRSR